MVDLLLNSKMMMMVQPVMMQVVQVGDSVMDFNQQVVEHLHLVLAFNNNNEEVDHHQQVNDDQRVDINIQVIRQNSLHNLHVNPINVNVLTVKHPLRVREGWKKCYLVVLMALITVDRNDIDDPMFLNVRVLCLVHWRICIEDVFER